MFGYVRPYKPDLLIREFTRYQAVYCGICKQIGRQYGQIARLALGYDLTMLAVLLFSLDRVPAEIDITGCILNPVKKKPVIKQHDILALSAALTVLLTWYKAADDKSDGAGIRGQAVQMTGLRAFSKAKKAYPDYNRSIKNELQKLSDFEKNHARTTAESPALASEYFGHLLKQVFRQAAKDCLNLSGREAEALGLIGYDIGRWIYIIDAIDDYHEDRKKGRWNPFKGMTYDQASQQAESLMTDYEQALDQTAALLPYYHDSGLVANICQRGLPEVRQAVLQGNKLGKL